MRLRDNRRVGASVGQDQSLQDVREILAGGVSGGKKEMTDLDITMVIWVVMCALLGIVSR